MKTKEFNLNLILGDDEVINYEDQFYTTHNQFLSYYTIAPGGTQSNQKPDVRLLIPITNETDCRNAAGIFFDSKGGDAQCGYYYMEFGDISCLKANESFVNNSKSAICRILLFE